MRATQLRTAEQDQPLVATMHDSGMVNVSKKNRSECRMVIVSSEGIIEGAATMRKFTASGARVNARVNATMRLHQCRGEENGLEVTVMATVIIKGRARNVGSRITRLLCTRLVNVRAPARTLVPPAMFHVQAGTMGFRPGAAM